MCQRFKTKLLWVTLIIVLLIAPFCFATNEAVPLSEDSENTSDVSETPDSDVEASYSFLSSDMYRMDSDVSVSEMVDGNAFLLGNSVTISGEINGDLFVCANTLTIEESAIIYGRIFACAQTFMMKGVAYDAYIVSNEMTMSETAYFERDIKVASDSISLNGLINRSAYLMTNSLSFPSEISEPIVGGNLEYISSSEFEIPENAVNGNTKFTLQASNDEETNIAALLVSYINRVLSAVLYSLAVLLLMIWLTPNFIQKSGNLMQRKTPLAFGIGLLTFVGTIAVSFALLFLTYGLGSAISVAAITLLILLLTISETIFALAGARLLARKIHQEKTFQIVLYTLLNVFVINLLKLIPFVGGIIGIAVSLIGLGYMMVNLIFKKQDFMTVADSAVEQS